MPPRRLHLVLVLLAATACYTWRAEPPSPDATAPSFRGHVVRLTLADGRRITVRDPYTVQDTLRALEAFRAQPALVVLPMSQVRLIESEEARPITVLITGLGLVLAASLFALVLMEAQFPIQ